MGVRRERGKPAMALLAKAGRPVGSAFITLPSGIRERLWQRVKQAAKPAPASKAHIDTQWLKPGLVARVRFLKGEETLRHATLKDWREDD